MRISLVTKVYVAAAVALSGVIAVAAWWRHSQLTTVSNLLNEHVQSFLARTLFRIGGQPVRIFFIIKTILFLIFLNLVARFARSLLALLVSNNPRVDKRREYIASKSITLAVYVVGILVGIQIENINFTTLAIIGGTLGIGVGFGLQSLVSNFVAGMILLFEQPMRIGDCIEFGDKTGEVVRIGSRSSSIRTYDNAILVVPNSDFVTKQILNWTISDPKIRITLPVAVAYQVDPQVVIDNLLALANNHAEVLNEPSPVVELSELGANGIEFSLKVWTLSLAEDFTKLRSDLYIVILKRFKELNIELSSPQLDLHVKSINPPASEKYFVGVLVRQAGTGSFACCDSQRIPLSKEK